jgi:hypothetical protein
LTKRTVSANDIHEDNYSQNWLAVSEYEQMVAGEHSAYSATILNAVRSIRRVAVPEGYDAVIVGCITTIEARLRHEMRVKAMGIFDKAGSKASKQNWLLLLTDMDSDKAMAAIIGVVQAGHTLSFARTKQGNAVVISIYDGKENSKAYPETPQDLDEVLETIANEYGVRIEAPAPLPVTSVVRSRSRKATNDPEDV